MKLYRCCDCCDNMPGVPCSKAYTGHTIPCQNPMCLEGKLERA